MKLAKLIEQLQAIQAKEKAKGCDNPSVWGLGETDNDRMQVELCDSIERESDGLQKASSKVRTYKFRLNGTSFW